MKGNLGQDLLWTVYMCHACPRRFGFERPEPDRPYYKFPPTIGADGQADLLFVGINPRLAGNRELHNRLMNNRQVFEDLARNRDGQQAYIAGADQSPTMRAT